MTKLTIRGLPEGVVVALRHRAKAHARSVEAELRALVTDGVAPPGRRLLGSELMFIGRHADVDDFPLGAARRRPLRKRKKECADDPA
jgi:plasmid stability protein